MKRFTRLAVGASAVLGLSALVAPVAAGADGLHHGPPFGGGTKVVFVQTDNTAGNQVAAYHRAGNGTLTLDNTYNTGGLGGALNGSHVDHLGSQGSLNYDPRNDALYAVNAGSNTVSVFSVRGDDLTLRQVVSSGGTFPVSVAVARRPGLGSQRSKWWVGAGVLLLLRASVPGPGIESSTGSDPPDRHHGVHPHTRTGCLLAGWHQADRDDEGQFQCG